MADKKVSIITIKGCIINRKPVKAFTEQNVSINDSCAMIGSGRAVLANDDNKKVIADMKKSISDAEKKSEA